MSEFRYLWNKDTSLRSDLKMAEEAQLHFYTAQRALRVVKGTFDEDLAEKIQALQIYIEKLRKSIEENAEELRKHGVLA